jgi:hypothetical protein
MPGSVVGSQQRFQSQRSQGPRASREGLSVQASSENLKIDMLMQPPHLPHASTEAMGGLLEECHQFAEEVEICNEFLEFLVEDQRSYWSGARRSREGVDAVVS